MTEKIRPVGSEKIQDSAQRLKRIQELAGIKKNAVVESNTSNFRGSTLLHDVDASDGNNYGLVQEGASVFLKIKGVAGYDYMTGLENKTEHKYTSLAEGLRHLNIMIKDINASTGNIEGTDILKKK